MDNPYLANIKYKGGENASPPDIGLPPDEVDKLRSNSENKFLRLGPAGSPNDEQRR